MVTLIRNVQVGPRFVRDFPDGANMIADVLGAGPEIEISLATILGLLSGSDPQASAIVLRQMRNASDQEQAVLNVARARMTPEAFTIVKIGFECTRSQRKRRNRFAHNPWARSDELPGAIFLIEATKLARFVTGIAGAVPGAASPVEALFEIEDGDIYRAAEIQRAREEAQDAASVMRLLILYVAACRRPDLIRNSTTPEGALVLLRNIRLFANAEKAFRAREEKKPLQRERDES